MRHHWLNIIWLTNSIATLLIHQIIISLFKQIWIVVHLAYINSLYIKDSSWLNRLDKSHFQNIGDKGEGGTKPWPCTWSCPKLCDLWSIAWLLGKAKSNQLNEEPWPINLIHNPVFLFDLLFSIVVSGILQPYNTSTSPLIISILFTTSSIIFQIP